MAPLQDTSPFSSLTNLFKRTLDGASNLSARDFSNKLISRTNTILPRSTVNPSKGVVSPSNIPNKFVFILLGLIGAGFVLTGIWFFFIAKNGGFYFQENDWDDYKSTVLRRKGPNGTTLSGATESTDLGGGSIVHGEKRWRRKHKGGKSRYTDYETSAGGTSVTGGSDISEMKWKSQKESKKSRSRRGGLRGGGGEEDEEMDIGIPDAVRAYRHEKPARVGGINKLPDGSSWDGSTQDAMTDLLSNREKTPTNTPTKVKKERKDSYTGGSGGGIRKVMPSMSERSTVSFWSRASSSKNKIEHKKHDDEDRIKAEAKKLQEIGRAAQRRDFSFQTGDEHEPDTSTVADEAEERKARREARREKRRQEKAALVPGNYAESSVGGSEVSTLVSDIDQTGTKSYHHVIPGLSSSAVTDYAEDRRNARRGGYRRGGTGSDDE